jgi:cytochrome P450
MPILGYNVHVVNSPDLIKLVLSSPHTVMQYPEAILKLFLGPHMLTQEQLLEMHGYVRRATMATYTGEKLRDNLSLINQMASEAVDSWLHRKSVNAYDELNKVLTGIPTSTGA